MAVYRFHLVASSTPIELNILASSIDDLCEQMTRSRFIGGMLAQSDGDGAMLSMLIATSRIQCVVEAF